MNLGLPFCSKELPNGKKLFRRKHGYTLNCGIGVSTKIISVPYNFAKINEVEIVGCPVDCTVNFKLLDTPTGAISTIPNYMLNQFGFSVNITKEYFKDISPYDADVIRDMQISIEITSSVIFLAGINIVFHEVV